MRTMIRLVLGGLPALLLTACNSSVQQREDAHTNTQTAAQGAIVGRPTLAMPMTIPGRSACIVAYAMEDEKGWFQSDDPFRKGGYAAPAASPARSVAESRYSYSGGSVRWHNAIVRDLKSGEQWPILDRRGVISWFGWFGPVPPKDAPFVATSLVFLATTEDTNHDGALNDLDTRVAIITDGSGRGARVVSPQGAQVWNVQSDPDSGLIYLQMVSDTNGDGKFDFNDAPVPYAVDPTGTAAASPVVSDAMLKRIEAMLK